MQRNHLFKLFSTSVILALMLSLFSTLPAFADDATPPAPTEEPALPPTDEPIATDMPAVTAEPPTEDTVQEEAGMEVEEILSQIPDGTELAVINENGESQPLATEEAADIILHGDPMWCPDGVTPGNDPGGTCTASFTNFADLINELQTNSGTYFGSGTVYVAYDYDAVFAGDTGDIIFDYGSMGLTNLVFQGGWNFIANAVTGTTTVNGSNSLQFLDWGGYGNPAFLTINDIILNGGDGLYIGDDSDFTTSNVMLSNIDVINTNYGAYIGTEGSATVINSSFDTNWANGLVIENGGDITLKKVTANGNYDTGAILDNSCGCATGNIFISSSTFNFNDISDNNDGRGLIAYSNGNITLANVIANGNAGGGAELDNTSGSGNIKLTGKNIFNNNGFGLFSSVGLYAISYGDVVLKGVTANGNGSGFGGGAFITSNNGNISITNSNFSNNCSLLCFLSTGLFAATNAGDITLNRVTANGNGDPVNGSVGIGTIIFNDGGNVFVKNSNFNGNCAFGSCEGGGIEIDVSSGGSVYFDHVTVNGNGAAGGGGAYIYTDGGNINIYCSTFKNNAGTGLVADILTSNTVTLNNFSFGGNIDGDIDLVNGGTLVKNPFDCNPDKKLSVPSLPLNIVNVTSGQAVDLDCVRFRGTLLVLPNGDRALLPCPVQGFGQLDHLENDNLPAVLPEGITFESAVNLNIFNDDTSKALVENVITIAFVLPKDIDPESMSILFWDEKELKWVDLSTLSFEDGRKVFDPGQVGEDGFFEALVNFTGTFVLVQK